MIPGKPLSFNFLSELVETNKQIVNDQNVYQFEFRNLGDVPVWINNSIYLPGMNVSGKMSVYKETINQEEKTKAQYSIRFENDTDFEIQLLQVIKKIPSK